VRGGQVKSGYKKLLGRLEIKQEIRQMRRIPLTPKKKETEGGQTEHSYTREDDASLSKGTSHLKEGRETLCCGWVCRGRKT